MSRRDELTNKGPLTGNKRSKAMNRSRRTWNVNLQKAKIKVDGEVRTVKVSARTIKTLRKNNKLA
jgi:large subunit ribosomal protein L28